MISSSHTIRPNFARLRVQLGRFGPIDTIMALMIDWRVSVNTIYGSQNALKISVT